MRRAIAVISVVVVVASGGAWAVAGGAADGDEARRAALTSGVRRATHYYRVGPSAEYDFDAGYIGVVDPLRLAFPAGSSYDVVVTVSLDYRTSAGDGFVLGLQVRRGSEYGHKESVKPETRAIAASTVSTSTTAVFLLKRLQGGRDYWFSPSVNVSHREGNRASIIGRRVSMVVDATPSG